MTRDEMRARIERQHEIWKRGDLDAIPGVDTVAFVAQMPKGWGSAEARNGHDGIRRALERGRQGFPDWHEHIEAMAIEGDTAAVGDHSTGTHPATFGARPASGHRLRVDELSIFRIAGGRAADQWCLNDDLAFDKLLRGESL